MQTEMDTATAEIISLRSVVNSEVIMLPYD